MSDIPEEILYKASQVKDHTLKACPCGGKIIANGHLGYCERCGMDFDKDGANIRAYVYLPIITEVDKQRLKVWRRKHGSKGRKGVSRKSGEEETSGDVG